MMRPLVVIAALALVAASCGSGGSGTESAGTQVIVDSDGAFDDVRAIAYLLEQPDVEILALTVSGTGIAHCPVAAENISAVLERLGAPDIPVACGRTTPLAGTNEAPQPFRDAADTLGRIELPSPRPLAEVSAPDLLAETLREANDEVVLVALGPLTNIAQAVTADPSVLDGVEMMYLMGGAVDAGGNLLYFGNPAAEFNIWADPLAAQRVFATDLPITLIPLDATNAVPVTPRFFEVLATHGDASPVARLLADYLEVTPLIGGMYQWDELAAVIATSESVATIEDRTLAVVGSGEANEGATIETGDGRPVRVAVDADPEAFETRFYDAILGIQPTTVPPWEPDALVTWDGDTCSYEGPDPLPDEFWIQVNNDGAEIVGLLLGTYEAGATLADLDEYRASGGAEPPEWWSPQIQIVASAGAREVWTAQGGADVTAVCFRDADELWELAGPRLTD